MAKAKRSVEKHTKKETRGKEEGILLEKRNLTLQ